MPFHLPKPLHGWRAFIGEVGVIVLGVLIALAFGQIAESIHDTIIAGQAREAVRAEVRENLWWLGLRERLEPCVRRRLAGLDDLLARARRGETIPVIQHLGSVPHAKITILRWQANAQAGRASLFSGDEQRMLGNMYYTTEQFWEAQQQEETTWSKMRFIQGLDKLTDLDVHDLGIFLAEARYQNWIVLLTLKRARQWAQRLQLNAANPGAGVNLALDEKREQICQPITAPLMSNPEYSGPDAIGEAQDVP
jgi:hypothetical protein